MPYLQDMCPAQLRQAQEETWPLLIGAGTIEYHGSQLPLGTDLLLVEGLLRGIEQRTAAVVAPSFAYSPTGYAVSGQEQGSVDVSTGSFMSYCGGAPKLRADGFRPYMGVCSPSGGEHRPYAQDRGDGFSDVPCGAGVGARLVDRPPLAHAADRDPGGGVRRW